MPTLYMPPDPSLPFFVYGLLQPGELAFGLIEPLVAHKEAATTSGTLWLRDGLPLLDREPDGDVNGHLLWFDPGRIDEAWSLVVSFEPPAQYRWAEVIARTAEGRDVPAIALAGRRLRAGTAGEPVGAWSARLDPVFVEGLDEVRALVLETAPAGVDVQPDLPELWRQFFRLQAAYLLLWSIVERYTALRFGPALDPGPRINRLGQDEAFREAVVTAGAEADVVVDSRAPEKRSRLQPDGAGASDYFYRVRSNLSHRGKSAFQDARLIFKAVVELHDAMRILLARQVPGLEAAWDEQESSTPLLRDALPDGVMSRSR